MLTLLLGVTSASATEWYLETPDRAERSEATALQEQALAAGHEARVVRRFADGQGWRFVVRIEDLGDPTTADAAATALANALDVTMGVFETDGTLATRLREIAPSDGEPEAPVEEELPEATPFLDAAVAAIGIDAAAFEHARSGPIRLDFRRTLADGRTIDHTWAARDGALYLEIEPLAGAAVASRTIVNGAEAWLSVGGGAWSSQNAERARATVEALGPVEVVPVVLALAAAVGTRREFERMLVAGSGEADGVATDVLRFAGDAVSAPLELEVGVEDHYIRRVRFGDDVLYELSGWRRSGGVALPSTIRALRDGHATDTVEITRLDLDPELPDAWFAAPR
jgi:hypothetical protein